MSPKIVHNREKGPSFSKQQNFQTIDHDDDLILKNLNTFGH